MGLIRHIRAILRSRHHRSRDDRGRSQDDYDWTTYSRSSYRPQLLVLEQEHLLVLSEGDYRFEHDHLIPDVEHARFLHPNCFLLYETILQLAPQSVFEFGCGGGDHLANLLTLRPHMRVYGVDVSGEQLALAHDRHPTLADRTWLHNITCPRFRQRFPKSISRTRRRS